MSERRAFEPLPTSVRDARHFVQSVLESHGITARSPTVAELALLAVSELATNAVQHAQTPYEVVIDTGGPLRIGVVDSCASVPRLGWVGPEEERGRGVSIVDTTADRWGVRRQDTGKQVWWEVDLR